MDQNSFSEFNSISLLERFLSPYLVVGFSPVLLSKSSLTLPNLLHFSKPLAEKVERINLACWAIDGLRTISVPSNAPSGPQKMYFARIFSSIAFNSFAFSTSLPSVSFHFWTCPSFKNGTAINYIALDATGILILSLQ